MVSEKPWTADALLLLISSLLLSISLGWLINITAPQMLPANLDLDLGFLQFVVSTLSFQGAALALIHFFLRRHHMSWRDIVVGREQPVVSLVVIGLGVGLLVVPVALTLNYASLELVKLVQLPAKEQAAVTVIAKTVEPSKRVWFALAAIVMAPIAEEMLYRGIMYPYLKPRIGPRLAVAITSMVFAASHLNLVIFIPLVFFGYVLTWIYEKTDSLLTSITAHAMFNAINFFLLAYQKDLARWFHERA